MWVRPPDDSVAMVPGTLVKRLASSRPSASWPSSPRWMTSACCAPGTMRCKAPPIASLVASTGARCSRMPDVSRAWASASPRAGSAPSLSSRARVMPMDCSWRASAAASRASSGRRLNTCGSVGERSASAPDIGPISGRRSSRVAWAAARQALSPRQLSTATARCWRARVRRFAAWRPGSPPSSSVTSSRGRPCRPPLALNRAT